MSEAKKRVFISSVQKELEVERVAIAGAVSGDEGLSQFCDVVLYDKEPLSGRRIAKPYLRCLDSCDIYILVMDREYGRIVETISATHEEYRYAMKRGMPMMIFVRGQHDAERRRETQAFFDEIRKDGHIYRRFHDRVDLLPEVKKGLARIVEEFFALKVDHAEDKQGRDVGKASLFEQQMLNIKGTKLDLDVALEWLHAVKEIGEGEKPANIILLNKLREKGLVWKESGVSAYRAMASGLLFLGRNPSEVFSQCRILLDAYGGVEPDVNPKDQDTISGPAPRIIDRVVDFVMSNTRHPIRIVGLRRVKLDEYPREVIREAIVNAVAHRDYEDAARPIYVKVFFDRVEILSAGNLLPPLTINKLIKGNYEPCSRNPTLAHYLGHLRLMEQRGSGIRRMQAAMLDHGLKSPEYVFRDGYFTVTLRGPGDDINQIKPPIEAGILSSIEERLTDRQRHIVEWLAAGQTITNRECQERFDISKVTATKELRALVEAGFAEQIGKGRSVRYIYSRGNR
ncbi:Transcriptional regulator with a HTH domain [uncultured Desulfobacterium sp.]|uniref:Transcriptional regulator with a HTH domain n=1 Tax=uncultured Desulfobacterium sp. TaxID=201089 RepID=A0A445MTD7_9BACT|nr:Transcriptional regulator with a HTH domain [uncultured Desulfobacterium sp.]